MFASNVAPTRTLKVLRDWTCRVCGNRNAGERYSCQHCKPGRRNK